MRHSDGAPLPLLRFETFEGGVVHGVSTRSGGSSTGPFASLNLGGRTGDVPETVQQNRAVFLGALGHRPETAVGLRQVHSSRVVIAGPSDLGRGLAPGAPMAEQADALITVEPGLALVVLAADCVPVLLWDPVRGAAGAVHAGWRGTVAGIAARAVEAMTSLGSRPEDIRAGIGPAIGGCCYEVDEYVTGPLSTAHPRLADRVSRRGRPGHWMLDLPEANRLQLSGAGLRDDRIEVMGLCTACHPDLLFSHRALGSPCGRFGAAIALR